MTDTKPKNELIYLRFPPAELTALRAAGEANHRSVRDEILHRLAAYRPAEATDGAPMGDAEAIGLLAASIVRQVNLFRPGLKREANLAWSRTRSTSR